MAGIEARFDELKTVLDEAQRIVISGHENADGDAVGAVSALRRHLEIEDKEVSALLLEPLSPRYGFMEFGRHYEVYDVEAHRELLDETDVFVICDLSSWRRMGALSHIGDRDDLTTVCIDHHPHEGEGPATVNLLDPGATATGRIVWDYIQHVGGRVDREIAESVFVSICTDTGWFRYPNTTPDVIALAARLAEHRLDLPGIYRAIYQANSAPMLRLLGHATRTMREECDGSFVWAFIRREFVDDLGVGRFDVDPILDVLRSGGRVESAALFTEQADGSVAVSLRSRGQPDVNAIAREYGGGGHVFAAGATLPAASAERDVQSMVATVRRALRPD